MPRPERMARTPDRRGRAVRRAGPGTRPAGPPGEGMGGGRAVRGLSAPVTAPAGRGGTREGAIGRTRLPNGVVVLTEHMGGVRSLALGVWVRQGTVHESPAEAGASHLLEHMVFKGTRRRTAAEIALALERLGGSLDAYTTREHTSYQARVLDEHLPEALDVLADLVLAPRLEQAELDLEREVVLEEIAQVEDTPDDLVFDLHAERFWRGHPWGRPILGTRESVGGMQADTLRAIHGARYTGENLVIAAAGNVDHEELVGRVAALFGDAPTGARAPAVDEPGEPARGLELLERPGAQTHVVFGAPVPGHGHPDRHAHVLLSAALGGGMSSRLFQRVREELGLCYSIFTYQAFHEAVGISGVYVGTRPATAERAVEAVRAELARVAQEGLPTGELEDVRRQVKGQIVLSLESPVSRMYRLASLELHGEPIEGLEATLAKIDRVGLQDVRRVAAAHYGPDLHYVLALGPGAGAAA